MFALGRVGLAAVSEQRAVHIRYIFNYTCLCMQVQGALGEWFRGSGQGTPQSAQITPRPQVHSRAWGAWIGGYIGAMQVRAEAVMGAAALVV